MRSEPITWDFRDNACLNIYSYKPIDDNTAKIEGNGKVWNDRVTIGDKIITKSNIGLGAELIVMDIDFISDSSVFSATIKLGVII